MRYISTRSFSTDTVSFQECIMQGLASDGGLFMPTNIPKLEQAQIAQFRDMSFVDMAPYILHPFMADEVPFDDLVEICQKSWAGFTHPDITPLVAQGDVHILELFHGPTLAFKDVALQFLAKIFDYFVRKNNQHTDEKITILGATSGDTGAAAIEAFRHLPYVDIFILHPHEKVSPIQRRMMCCVTDDNVHNIAVKGNFDDCQKLVKQILQEESAHQSKNNRKFARKYASINSINFGRILAQIVYYFYAASRLQKLPTPYHFIVPTGNFGDIFAGFLAMQMGLQQHGDFGPLVIANNSNDLLTRCWRDGVYAPQAMHASLAPAMDIQIASNFERLLYLYGGAKTVHDLQAALSAHGSFNLPNEVREKFKNDFKAAAASDDDIAKIMQEFHQHTDYILDPHTATGKYAVKALNISNPIILSTAHPVKFVETIEARLVQSGYLDQAPDLPAAYAQLNQSTEYFDICENDIAAIRAKLGQ